MYLSDHLHLLFFREFFKEYWRRNTAPTVEEEDDFLKNARPDFISWFRTKVPSNLPRSNFEIPICTYERVM
jgi:hypothetical protein